MYMEYHGQSLTGFLFPYLSNSGTISAGRYGKDRDMHISKYLILIFPLVHAFVLKTLVRATGILC